MPRSVIQAAASLAIFVVAACAPQVIQQSGPTLSKKTMVTTPALVAAATSAPTSLASGNGYVESGATLDFVWWAHLPSRRRLPGDRVQMWVLQNYIGRSPQAGASIRYLLEFECGARAQRLRAAMSSAA